MASVASDVLVAPAPAVSPKRRHGSNDVVLRRIDGCRDLLALHRLNPRRYPHLLESVAQGTSHSRYDILFAFPGDSLHISSIDELDFLSELDTRWKDERIPCDERCELPFRGGWFLYLSYEVAAQVEARLRSPAAPYALPLAFATRIPAAVICDHHLQQTWLVAETRRCPAS